MDAKITLKNSRKIFLSEIVKRCKMLIISNIQSCKNVHLLYCQFLWTQKECYMLHVTMRRQTYEPFFCTYLDISDNFLNFAPKL